MRDPETKRYGVAIMATEPGRKPAPPAWRDLLICTTVLMAAYAGRGWYLAAVLGGGRYPGSALAVDVLALGFLIVLFRGVDAAIRRGVRRWPGQATRFRKVAGGVLNFALTFALAAPVLTTLSQLHPQRIAPILTPGDHGRPFEEVQLRADGRTLAGWHLPAPQGQKPAVVIAHGVGASRQNFLPVAEMVQDLGHPVLLFDFRAHGDSGGQLSTLGLGEADDVRAAHAWLAARYPGRPIHGLGYSMGGAALCRAAADGGGFDRIVLDSVYARAESPARQALARLGFPGPAATAYWGLTRFWAWAFTGADLADLTPEAWIGQRAGRPVLIVHGAADTTTPPADAQALYDRAGGAAALWLVPGADHLQTLNHPDYPARLAAFLAGPAGANGPTPPANNPGPP
jgi:alpha-beta hydrolase superfamily lysophospholipase